MPTKKEKENPQEIKLVTTNNNGVFHAELNKKGKEVNTLAWENCEIELPNGDILTSDIRPKYEGWYERDYLEQLKKDRSVLFLEPMSAHEDTSYLKKNELKDFEIAELKMDGHRGVVHIGEKDNRVFSRRVSTKTDWYNENTDQVPHIRDLVLKQYAGTVLDGEFDYGTTSMGVQSVMGSLPANAIQYQFNNGFIKFFAFDILYYKGINIQKLPLWKRKIFLAEVLLAFAEKYGHCNMKFTDMYMHEEAMRSTYSLWVDYETDAKVLSVLKHGSHKVKDYRELMTKVLEEDKEGLMIKDIHSIYEQKKTKNMLKLKGTSTWDCVMMGITESTKEYEGKELRKWKYWEVDGELMELEGEHHAIELANTTHNYAIPVTKPYFMGWCGGIEFGVYKDGKLIRVGDCKGLTEAVQIDLKENWQRYVKEKRVLEVKANGIIDKKKGSLRHPRFLKWRDDKDHSACTFDHHIRVINE